MIRREASRRILSMASAHSVLTVAGPRHSGKTTLVRRLFPRYSYVNLDNPDVRCRARADPAGFIGRYSGDLIVDEYLRVPELWRHVSAQSLSRRRVILVTSRMPARWLARRSTQPVGRSSMQPVGRSSVQMAGRSSVQTPMQILLPLSISELRAANIDMGRDEYIYRGFMPRVYGENGVHPKLKRADLAQKDVYHTPKNAHPTPKNIDPAHVYKNYLAYLVDRDIRRFAGIDTGDPPTRAAFGRLIMLLAARVGQIINPDALANEIGVCVSTLALWMAALEASFVIFKLPCLRARSEKQGVRVPKYYFTDVGMAAFLLKIQSAGQVFRDPAAGGLFENMVVAEALKSRFNSGSEADLYYYRDASGLEIDLVVDKKTRMVPVEIKSQSAASSAHAKNIARFKTQYPDIADGCVIYSGKTREKGREGHLAYVNFRDTGGIVV